MVIVKFKETNDGTLKFIKIHIFKTHDAMLIIRVVGLYILICVLSARSF